MDRNHPRFGVHDSHCWQNEYMGCKYGDDDCPATPDVWPHPTYEQNGLNIWLAEDGTETPRPGRAWGEGRQGEVTYAHRDDPDGPRFYTYDGAPLPEWAVDVQLSDYKAKLPAPRNGMEFEHLPGDSSQFRVKSIKGVEITHGLCRLYWKSGGSSLAAIGGTYNGQWWVAPTNWIDPATPLRLSDGQGRACWDDIDSIEFFDFDEFG